MRQAGLAGLFSKAEAPIGRPDHPLHTETVGQERWHVVERDFGDGRTAAHWTLDQHRVLVDEYRKAPIDLAETDHEAGHEGRLGVGRGEPVVHLNVDSRNRFGDESVHVGPTAVLKDLKDELVPILHEPVAPPGLIALHPDLEGNGIEEAAAAESHVGQPGRAVDNDAQQKVIERARGGPSGPMRTRANMGSTWRTPRVSSADARSRFCSKQ